jgi:DNA repair protein RadC
MTIKNLPKDERPRERLLNHGEIALSMQELIAIILKTAPRGKSALKLAEEILNEIPENELSETTVDQLLKIKGLGKVNAITLASCLEIHRRLSSIKSMPKEKLSKPQEVAEFLKNKFSFEKQEIFGYIFLDSKNNIVRISNPFKGTSNFAPVEAKEIFGPAMVSKAAKVILFHNHPSGDPTPSKEDIEFTEKIKDLGEKLQIPIIDHIIIGTYGWYSFAKEGLI